MSYARKAPRPAGHATENIMEQIATFDAYPPTVEYRPIEIKAGYRIGDDGDVRSAWNRGGRTKSIGTTWRSLKPTPNHDGYLLISLGHDTRVAVHRLVLHAFIGPCPEGMECRHKDGNRANNRLENLEWATREVNLADRRGHGSLDDASENFRRKLDQDKADEIRRMAAEGRNKLSIARHFGVSRVLVRKIIAGDLWRGDS